MSAVVQLLVPAGGVIFVVVGFDVVVFYFALYVCVSSSVIGVIFVVSVGGDVGCGVDGVVVVGVHVLASVSIGGVGGVDFRVCGGGVIIGFDICM